MPYSELFSETLRVSGGAQLIQYAKALISNLLSHSLSPFFFAINWMQDGFLYDSTMIQIQKELGCWRAPGSGISGRLYAEKGSDG